MNFNKEFQNHYTMVIQLSQVFNHSMECHHLSYREYGRNMTFIDIVLTPSLCMIMTNQWFVV